jgi:hypothetical protein
VKITKARLKEIIKEELEKVMALEESTGIPEGDAGQQFVGAVRKLQSVLKKYNLDDYTSGTYDPTGVGDSSSAWNRYTKQWNLVHADPAFKQAEKSLLGLIVKHKYDKTPLRIEDVGVTYGGFEASRDMVIHLVDPSRPVNKNGSPKFVESLSFSQHDSSIEFMLEEVESVSNPQQGEEL